MKLVIFAPIIATLALLTPTLAFADTADYWYGYRIGQEDSRARVYDIGSSCDSVPNGDWSHCAAGYHDGFYM